MADTQTSLKDKIRALVDDCDRDHAITGVDIAAKLLTGYANVHYHLSRLVVDGRIERSLDKPWRYWRRSRQPLPKIATETTPGSDTGERADAVRIRPVNLVPEPAAPPAPPIPPELAALRQFVAGNLESATVKAKHRAGPDDAQRPAEAAFHIDGTGRIAIELGADTIELDPLNALRLRRFIAGVGPLLDLLEHDAQVA
ncbi:MAG: hypothetical protein KA179_00055 [Sulfuritalea sp.]|nr:hypothetical protein [Sulfuritalea sp.]